ncbi:MAG: hypothetical protein H2038_11295 [Brevundimonas sp.]|uniref:hypothetical protein n=1 Tax=Brevundimonas sp. TaxID=1871086 RepID=UPI0017BD9BF1|nr:hypothetical protein [Brevundimonas sp.]MBA4805227.1 hypothetical protein [Brevundimonas sp.]
MSKFSLRLHHLAGLDPVDEPLDVLELAEARELARVRLLLTRDYSRVELHRGGEALEVLERDSLA